MAMTTLLVSTKKPARPSLLVLSLTCVDEMTRLMMSAAIRAPAKPHRHLLGSWRIATEAGAAAAAVALPQLNTVAGADGLHLL